MAIFTDSVRALGYGVPCPQRINERAGDGTSEMRELMLPHSRRNSRLSLFPWSWRNGSGARAGRFKE